MNAKEIFEVPNLTKNLTQEFHAHGRPRSGIDANLSLERGRNLLHRKKNAFTFTATAEVRSTIQTVFNIHILRI